MTLYGWINRQPSET